MTKDTFIDDFGAPRIFAALSLPVGASRVLALLTSVIGDPAGADDVGRVFKTCSATASPGEHSGECNIALPPGRRFVITSATARGSLPSAQYVAVRLFTTIDGTTRAHDFQPGLQVSSNGQLEWTGAIPGVVWSDPGTMKFQIVRGSSTTGKATFWLALSGYLE